MDEQLKSIVALAGSTTFGRPVRFSVELSDASKQQFEHRIDDYAEAHAEAEARLQELSAG